MAVFVKNNIADIAYAISYLATVTQNAHGYIMLRQGKNGGENMVSVALVFDDDMRFNQTGVETLSKADDFKKLGVPDDIAAFLADIPFTGEDKRREILYKFSPEEMNESDWTDAAYINLRHGANDTKYGYDIGAGLSFTVEVARKIVGTVISFSIR